MCLEGRRKLMKQTVQRKHTTELVFMVLLFFIFGLCALFTILIGAQAYQNIGKRMDENSTQITALSYVSNKVKQADQAGMVTIKNINDTNVLCLQQEIDQIFYETWIYYDQGYIKELFSQKDSGLTLKDGIEIIPSRGLSFFFVKPNLLEVRTQDGEGKTQLLSLRSGVDYDS